MTERKYILTVVRQEIVYPLVGMNTPPQDVKVRDIVVTITEAELDIIKQALIKVWK